MSVVTINKSFEELTQQAIEDMSCRLQETKTMIDKHFGDGYAAAHPELVGQVLLSITEEYKANAISKSILEHSFEVSYALSHEKSEF